MHRGAFFPAAGVLVGSVLESLSNPDAHQAVKESSRWALYFFAFALASVLICLVESYLLEGGTQRLTRRMRKDGVVAILKQVRTMSLVLHVECLFG